MSHVADVQLEIKDINALKAAVESLGAIFVEGQQTFKWYGEFMNDWSSNRAASNRHDAKDFGKCVHAIKVEGVEYEIGVVKTADGYSLLYDSWGPGRGLEEKFGEGMPRIKQAYSTEVSRRELKRKGYRVTTINNADGSVQLKAVRS